MTVATKALPIEKRASSVTTTIEWITPVMAQEYLTYNVKNRNISATAIANFVAGIRLGEWDEPNGESIIFGDDDSLLDGQHRLLAIIQAGKTIPLIVVRGVSAEKRHTIDTGMKRTFGHTLAMAGEKHVNTLAAALRWLYTYENDKLDEVKYLKAFHSYDDAQAFFLAHQSIRDSVWAAKRMAPFYTPGPSVFLHYIFAQKN